MIELDKAYKASEVEDKIYEKWLQSGYFNPDNLPDQTGEAFSIILPPPNVTGTLHMGHAFETAVQDIIIRYQRMQGKGALWVPGTDHAAIATQAKFEKELTKKEKKSRHDFSREEFVSMVNKFALENQTTILSQLKKLGLSLDWSRLAFTMDESRGEAVKLTFKKLYDAGVVYRGFRVVNWDPKGQTTVSDDEVIHEPTKATMYTFKYAKDFPISISTTRPETKLGDTAMAVHPDDKRYKKFVGQTFDVEFAGVDLNIKIIADEAVDPEFGTGALGVTPAHSMIDWDMAQRHDLPLKPVINEFAKMTAPGYENKKSTEAREMVTQWLRDNGLMEKEEQIDQNISKAERTGGIIEPLPKLQWFVDVNKNFSLPHSRIEGISAGQEVSLKQIMQHVVESKQIEIMPERFEKVYFHWINNLRDWCVSRQLLYGHRIPAWYKGDEIYVGDKPEGQGWEQDPDTFDTWFSAGMWTFTTLGWPNTSDDLTKFHPTSIIMPGYEILQLWVARMILMTGFLLGDIPFRKVYLHGMVRDSKGQKFSKSLDNGVDPLEITAKYGTDALRMALIAGVAPGNDTIFDLQKVKAYQHFANKLWNIARFILANVENLDVSLDDVRPSSEGDKTMLEKLQSTVAEMTLYLDTYRLHEAAQAIYQFTWHEFADIYIELAKQQLHDPDLKAHTEKILAGSLVTILKLLHPFMPFVTEEIWSKINQKTLLLVSRWPK